MLEKTQAAERFPTLDPKGARSIPDLRQAAEILEARSKLEELEGQLVTVKAEIVEAEKRPDRPRTGADIDALQILDGKPLDRQLPVGDLAELRRRRVALERAVELQREALGEITRRAAQGAIAQLGPLARKYAVAAVEAMDRLEDALEALNSFFSFLSTRGFKPGLLPGHWTIFPTEINLLNLAAEDATVRREAFGLPAKPKK